MRERGTLEGAEMVSSSTNMRLILTTLLGAFCLASSALASDATSAEKAKISYLMIPRDLVAISVYDEPDLAVEQRLDGQGTVRVPLLGNVRLAGLTVREGEKRLAEAFVENRFLVSPELTIHVMEYAPRLVSVLGEVNNPGPVQFPVETGAMDIVYVISLAGDFTGVAKTNAVKVRRTNANGEETRMTVDVTAMVGSGKEREATEANFFLVYPDDVIFVPERLF